MKVPKEERERYRNNILRTNVQKYFQFDEKYLRISMSSNNLNIEREAHLDIIFKLLKGKMKLKRVKGK